MGKFIYTLIIFVSLFVMFSCGIKRYHTNQIECKLGGTDLHPKKYKVLKSNGKKISGVFYDEYDNGQIKFEVTCKKGLNMDSTSWYKNGQKSYCDTLLYYSTVEAYNFQTFKSDKMPHLLYKEWYENGNLKTEHFDKEYHKEWYENGQIKSIVSRIEPYEFNKINFSYRSWHENGKLKEYDFTDDLNNKLCFDENGNSITCVVVESDTSNFNPFKKE